MQWATEYQSGTLSTSFLCWLLWARSSATIRSTKSPWGSDAPFGSARGWWQQQQVLVRYGFRSSPTGGTSSFALCPKLRQKNSIDFLPRWIELGFQILLEQFPLDYVLSLHGALVALLSCNKCNQLLKNPTDWDAWKILFLGIAFDRDRATSDRWVSTNTQRELSLTTI